MSVIGYEKTEVVYDGEESASQIDYAKFLLTQTSVPIPVIATGCGWQNERIFATVFEQSVGVTPLHYRNWHQGLAA